MSHIILESWHAVPRLISLYNFILLFVGYDESSDPGMGDAPTGGYRAVPSDTDTSAFDSDPNAHLTDGGRHKRLGRKARKNLKNHDEAWFMTHDTKTWSRIRIGCFWFSVVCMLAACVVAQLPC